VAIDSAGRSRSARPAIGLTVTRRFSEAFRASLEAADSARRHQMLPRFAATEGHIGQCTVVLPSSACCAAAAKSGRAPEHTKGAKLTVNAFDSQSKKYMRLHRPRVVRLITLTHTSLNRGPDRGGTAAKCVLKAKINISGRIHFPKFDHDNESGIIQLNQRIVALPM
jgi:hypothetical protein